MWGRFVLCWLLMSFCCSSWAVLRVTFISSGHAQEAYWIDVATAMQKAAQDLSVDLSILYAERDRLREIALVREVTQLPTSERPDYLIVGGEKQTLLDQLLLADSVQLPVFLIANPPTPQERPALGLPRARFKYWLGSLTPQAPTAGYETLNALVEAANTRQLPDNAGQLHLLALSGSYSTGSSLLRNQGLMQSLAEHPQVILHQMVQSDWSRSKSYEQMVHLLKRYPQANLVWAGNDEMALGALQAAEEGGRLPGRDVLFSGINTSREAMRCLVEGKLSALAGGHFLTGALALVVLYDYHHGIDFADAEGLEMDCPLFMLFSPQQARAFLAHQPISSIDFRRYSKWLHPEQTRYDFSVRRILEPAL